MRLKEIYNQILREQGEEASQIIEFPKEKFIVSVDKLRKTLLFTPQDEGSLTNKIRPMVVMIKRNFNTSSVKNQDDQKTYSGAPEDDHDVDLSDASMHGSIMVTLDPREDINKVVDFLNNQAGQQ